MASDLGRFGLLLSIPTAYALGVLSLAQLYGVAFAIGSLSVVFDVAYQAYLPSVVEPERLIRANSQLQVSEQGASVVGPAFGGLLISLLTAPFAVLADAVSYLFSGALVASIGVAEPASTGRSSETARRSMIREIRDGLRYVLRHPILRPMVMTSALTQLFGRVVMAVLLIYLVREAGLSAAAVGTVLSIGSAGFVLGAVIAPWVSRRLGLGRALTLAAVIASLGPCSTHWGRATWPGHPWQPVSSYTAPPHSPGRSMP